jgi:hypothetical protein
MGISSRGTAVTGAIGDLGAGRKLSGKAGSARLPDSRL